MQESDVSRGVERRRRRADEPSACGLALFRLRRDCGPAYLYEPGSSPSVQGRMAKARSSDSNSRCVTCPVSYAECEHRSVLTGRGIGNWRLQGCPVAALLV